MKMKLFLTALFLGLLLPRFFMDLNNFYLLLAALMVVLLFFLITRDKANTFRTSLCVLSVLAPLYITFLPYLASVFLNDERLRRMWRWRFIVLTGCDGSGKSSHARETARWLNEQGIEATYFHFFRNPILKRLSLLKRSLTRVSEGEADTYTPEFRRHVRKHFLPKLRPFICYLDNWAYISYVFLKNMLKGRWVVVDRYFYDFYVRFKCLGYPMPGFLKWLFTRAVLKPAIAITLDVRPEISSARRKDNPYWYHVKARGEHARLSEELHHPKINTERPFEIVQEEINKLIRMQVLHRA